MKRSRQREELLKWMDQYVLARKIQRRIDHAFLFVAWLIVLAVVLAVLAEG